MPTEPFTFTGSTGETLVGRLEMPEGKMRGWAIFAHCFTCGKDHIAAVHIARAMAEFGIGTLRFDFTGLGDSGGSFGASGFSANVEDLKRAAAALEAAGKPISLLVGHSLGGAAVLAAAGDLPQVRAVATLAAPFEVAEALGQFDPEGLKEIERRGEARVLVGGRPFTVQQRFVDDLRAFDDLPARIARLHRPLLVMHSPLDDIVAVDNAQHIFLAAKHPKSFVSLDHADHLLTSRADTDYAAEVITAWAGRYLPPLPAPEQPPVAGDAEAEETREGKFQVAIRAGRARFLADEPESVGGLGSGPSPYDLLSSALAACTTMTLRLYADGKGWPVRRIRTAVGHRREPGQQPTDIFSRRIAIEGPVDADQRARLLAMADRCPLHRTLEQGARFDTALGEPPADAEPAEAHAEAMDRIVADH